MIASCTHRTGGNILFGTAPSSPFHLLIFWHVTTQKELWIMQWNDSVSILSSNTDGSQQRNNINMFSYAANKPVLQPRPLTGCATQSVRCVLRPVIDLYKSKPRNKVNNMMCVCVYANRWPNWWSTLSIFLFSCSIHVQIAHYTEQIYVWTLHARMVLEFML